MKNTTRLLHSFFILISFSSLSQNITTVAGGGSYPGLEPLAMKYPAPTFYFSDAVAMAGNGVIYAAGIGQLFRINETLLKIDTIAGSGLPFNSGDGALAKLVNIDTPGSIAVDNAGNLFFSTVNAGTIRRIDAGTGIITTVGGNGTQGFSPDGTIATSAALYSPTALAVDNNGNIYFHDQFNYLIRRIDATTKILTTIAGAGTAGYNGDNIPAISAQIGYRVNIKFDASGNLYVCDEGNQRIRKIDMSTHIISTVAGTGVMGYSGDGGLATSAQLNMPASISFDAFGNLYIGDGANNRIRRIEQSTQIISTIAGTGLPAYLGAENGDGGLASVAKINSSGQVMIGSDGSIYVSEITRLRKINSSGEIHHLLGGIGFFGEGILATGAILGAPSGLGYGSGNIYTAEQGNAHIRKLNLSTGIISSVAGTGNRGNLGDNSLAVNAEIADPFQVKTNGNGDIFIADFGNSNVRKIDGSTGLITTVAGTGPPFTYGGDNGLAINASFNRITSIAIDPNGNLVIADRQNNRIRRVDKTTNIITTIAGNGTEGFSGDGDLATNAQLNNPTNILYDSKGNLFISDRLNHRIRKVAVSSGIITTIAGSGATTYTHDGDQALNVGINLPYGMAFDNSDNLLIADAGNNRILKLYPSTGLIISIAGNGLAGFSGDGGPSTSAKLNFPRDMVVTGDGTIYIADTNNNRIRAFKDVSLPPSPEITTALGTKENGLSTKGYPNPATNLFNVSLEGANNEALEAMVIDLSGRSHSINIVYNNQVASLQVGDLSPGIYLVRIKQAEKIWKVKFAKK